MMARIALFEVRYVLRMPLLWLTAAGTFALFFIATAVDGLTLGAEGGILENAAFATLRHYTMASLTYVFVTTAFVANAVLRDAETGFDPIVRSTGIGRVDYVLGRFLGAFAVAAACMLLLPVGVALGSALPSADSATLGPFRLVDHVYGYFVVALPNLLVHSAAFFALATITRSMMATYLGVIAFVSGFFVLQGMHADRPQVDALVALADPFASRVITDAARYWTVAERNVMLPEIAGLLVWNRVVWIGIAVLLLVLACRAWKMSPVGAPRGERKRQSGVRATAVEAGPEATPLPLPVHGPTAGRALLWMRTRFEMKQVVLSPAFVVLMAWGLYITGLVLLTQRDPDGRPTYPTTLSMIPEIAEASWMILLIVAIYYAGELVWRERDRRIDAIVDATPMPGWGYVVPKVMAMAIVLVAILLVTVVASIAVQLSLGFTNVEPGKYLLWYVLPRTWDMLLLAALAVFVQALSPHKAVGWGVMVLFVLWQQMNTRIDHNLLLYGGTPGVPFSDMNGAGAFAHAAWTFRVYWGSFAVLLLLAAHLLWRRGSDVRLGPRLASARRGLRGVPGLVGAGALLLFTASGAYAFRNTNVLNTYRPQRGTEARAAAFEKQYGRYADLPQPRIVGLAVHVALYPSERRAVTTGRFRLHNASSQAIPEIHVRLIGDDLELPSAHMAGARLVLHDREHRYRIYRLDRPMQPGEEREMTFGTRLAVRGFRNEPTFTRIVENGTFLGEGHLLPVVGFVRAGMLQDPAARRRHGLPEGPGVPGLEDSAATASTTYGRGWATTDITVSTSADQVPLAPGNKVSDVVRGGRRVARFVSGAPVHPRFSVLSARYAERHRAHRGIDLAVYHHPAHAWNVDRMLDAMGAALDYYRANFGPYPFDHARVVEFPGYLAFAQAMPGMIPYSEEVGFVSDYRQPGVIDYVTYLTAHEMAHQYWAHQVVGADVEGRELLSETLAQYSAQMVVRRMWGEDRIRRYLRYELDRYLEGHAGGGEEPTLTRVAGQDHVTYRKGALAMYLVQERLGEEAVNRALRSLLERYRFEGAPFPRSLDLVAALRAEAKTADDQALVTDLFERITLYHLEVADPTAVRRADGRWDVSVPIVARKFYADGEGAETEAPLDERIEIGLFTAEPGRNEFDARHVLMLERHAIRSGPQVLRFVTERRPSFAGVDPYNYYVDRNPADNVRAVR